MFNIGDRVVVERASAPCYNGITGRITQLVEPLNEYEKPIAVIAVEEGSSSKTVRFYTWKLSLLEPAGHSWEV